MKSITGKDFILKDGQDFLTCDDKLIKRALELGINLKVMNPLRFVEDLEVN